jgi:hypothetical protein
MGGRFVRFGCLYLFDRAHAVSCARQDKCALFVIVRFAKQIGGAAMAPRSLVNFPPA